MIEADKQIKEANKLIESLETEIGKLKNTH